MQGIAFIAEKLCSFVTPGFIAQRDEGDYAEPLLHTLQRAHRSLWLWHRLAMTALAEASHDEEKEAYFQGEGKMIEEFDCLHRFEIIVLLSSTIDDYI